MVLEYPCYNKKLKELSNFKKVERVGRIHEFDVLINFSNDEQYMAFIYFTELIKTECLKAFKKLRSKGIIGNTKVFKRIIYDEWGFNMMKYKYDEKKNNMDGDGMPIIRCDCGKEKFHIGKCQTYFGLPNKVKYCKKCTISNQRPNSEVEFKHNIKTKKKTINFGKDGVCDACKFNEKKKDINWKEREKELKGICDKHRRNDGRYDCIVPSSGGKDSVMTAWLLKYKYGMHPLTVTWAPHLYTSYGWNNFINLSHKGGFDNILFTPNGKVHRLLTKLAFKNLLHPFQPFILGQKNIGVKFALKYDVPLVIYGEDEAEYGNPIKNNSDSFRSHKFHHANDYMELEISGVKVKDLIEIHGLTLNDLKPYLPVIDNEVKDKRFEVRYMGYYERWDPQEAFYFAVEKTDFQTNNRRTEGTYSKYNSIDDKTDPFHYWTTLIKFGIGRATYDSAQEIRNGKITREEGVALVKKFDQEFPNRYFKEFLEYLDMDEKEFYRIADKFRSPHLWKKVEGVWVLKHVIR